MENLGKNRSYRIMVLFRWYLGIRTRQIMPGLGILFRFYDPGAGVLHWKAVPGAGILTEKISGQGVSPGGMVTSQIDTCITISPESQHPNCSSQAGPGVNFLKNRRSFSFFSSRLFLSLKSGSN